MLFRSVVFVSPLEMRHVGIDVRDMLESRVVVDGGQIPVDVIDEIATLHGAFPEALWKQFFGAYQMFLRGDSNADRRVDISDGIFTLAALFGGGSLGCQDAGDTNDDGLVDISDAIATFGFLFLGASKAPPYPFEDVGLDPTEDALGCARY